MDTKYAWPLANSSKSGQTAIYRNPQSINKLWKGPEGINSLQDIWLNNFLDCPDQEFLGQRHHLNGVTQDHFEFLTFRQIKQRADDLGSGMITLDLAPKIDEWKDYSLSMVAIYSKNSPDYIILDAACCLYGITSVPIYDTLGEEACQYMFEQTNLTTLFLTCNHLPGIVKALQDDCCGNIQNLVVMDEENFMLVDHAELLKQSQIKFYVLSQVMNTGHCKPQPYKPTTLNDIYTISYTSGTTSKPKGALISHENILTMTNSIAPLAKITGELRHISYLPLAHIYERSIMNYV